jgi:hypothetical protein
VFLPTKITRDIFLLSFLCWSFLFKVLPWDSSIRFRYGILPVDTCSFSTCIRKQVLLSDKLTCKASTAEFPFPVSGEYCEDFSCDRLG